LLAINHNKQPKKNMSKRTQALSTPESKAAWQRNKNIGSRFVFVGTPENGFAFPKRKYDEQGRRIA
jgi:hypothetical protein